LRKRHEVLSIRIFQWRVTQAAMWASHCMYAR
jgi:hypothetical protein